MLSLSPSQRIFLALEPVDMRKHFDGLWALASEKLQEDPFGGAWFVFTNKDRNRLKILCWDGSGVWVLAKRLEKGRFIWPVPKDGAVAISTAQLAYMLDGIDWRNPRQTWRPS